MSWSWQHERVNFMLRLHQSRNITQLATEPISEGFYAGSRTERIRRVLTELNDALALGDDILRELRPLLSPKHQKSLTRA